MKTVIAGALAASLAAPLAAQSTAPHAHVWSPGLRPPAPEPTAQPQSKRPPIPEQQARRLPPASPANPGGIHLVCDGTVSYTVSTTNYDFDYHSGHMVSIDGQSTKSKEAETEVSVYANGGSGRIKLPSDLVPLVHSGSDHGWRPFDALQMGETEIDGRLRLNFLNKPHVKINRLTGRIHISTMNGDFSGVCQLNDATAATRKF